MRPITRHSTRLASASRIKQPAAPQRRHILPQQPFSTSLQRSSDSRSPASSSEHQSSVNGRRQDADVHENESVTNGVPTEPKESENIREEVHQRTSQDAEPTVADRKSTLRWNARQKRVNEVPKPPPIPQWFLERNVRVTEERLLSDLAENDTTWSIRCVDSHTSTVIFTMRLRASPDYPDEFRELLDKACNADCPDGNDRWRLLFAPPKSDATAEQETDHSVKNARPVEPTETEPRTNQPLSGRDGANQQLSGPVDLNQLSERLRILESRLESLTKSRKLLLPDPVAWSFLEAESSLHAALSPANTDRQSSSFSADRIDLSLQCPDPNSHARLDDFVNGLTGVLRADMIRLDANDFAELSEEYVAHGDDRPGSFSNLGYDVFDGYVATQNRPSIGFRQPSNAAQDEEAEEKDEDEPDEYDITPSIPKGVFALLGGFVVKPHDLLSRSRKFNMRNRADSSEPRSNDLNRDDARLDALLDKLLDAGDIKRPMINDIHHSQNDGKYSQLDRGTTRSRIFRRLPSEWRWDIGVLLARHLAREDADESGRTFLLDKSTSDGKCSQDCNVQKRTIVHIRDLRDICNTPLGENIIRRLIKVVRKRRRAGECIVVVGTTAQDVPGPVRLPGDHSDDFPFRTLSLPPVFDSESRRGFYKAFFSEPSKTIEDVPGYPRIFEINLRHVQRMLQRFDVEPIPSLRSVKAYSQLNLPGTHFLTDRVLSLDEVQRLSLLAIGLSQSYAEAEQLCPLHVGLAASIFAKNDHYMQSWQAVKEKRDSAKSLTQNTASDSKVTSGESAVRSMSDELKESSNAHEKRLLSGVVDPENIKTRFKDVHVSSDTIDALKTLTSLSLLRPDAFKYGILANDRLPGLLLYGPPGTGKTLLAKAVAKDSKATVLEVTGAQIYEKYVGEGEKMVRAVFSLAKKLSPCVVFIDEADSIFGSRSSQTNRNTHREIINQFLREWDGMDDHSVLMVLASNRPFDLDDAVLRRLPRRLLIDLPVAKDRESILGIHLQDETLDSSVSLSKLAEQTPLYSGSDLKNLSVAAALACVREENELAQLHKDDAEFKLPEKRILTTKHFDKALSEVSASISENMSSLTAIRKFDEQYGDRKGRRKRTGYGFGVSDGIIDESAARVRQASPPSP